MEQIQFDLHFDREKYFQIAKHDGVQIAVDRLHHDLWDIEKICFDTPEGYQSDVWKTLNEMRLFSRELWDLSRE